MKKKDLMKDWEAIKIRNELQVKLKKQEKSHFKIIQRKNWEKCKMMRGKREREKGDQMLTNNIASLLLEVSFVRFYLFLFYFIFTGSLLTLSLSSPNLSLFTL